MTRVQYNIQKAFTLIELMIVVVIIGILAAIAMPSYSAYTTRAKIADAYIFSDFFRKLQYAKYSEHNFFFNASATPNVVTAVSNGERVTLTDYGWDMLENYLIEGNTLLQSRTFGSFSPASSPINFAIDVSQGSSAGSGAAAAYIGSLDAAPGNTKCFVNTDVTGAALTNYGVDNTSDSNHRWFSIALIANFAVPGSENCLFMIQTGQTYGDEVNSRPMIEVR